LGCGLSQLARVPSYQTPLMHDTEMPKLPERPRLAPGVRLHFDATRNAWVLLGPERVIETEGPANEILRLCDGVRTVSQIVDELAALYTAERDVIAGDVIEMLGELVAKRMVVG
jgi:pyrroloquinoline quinone biosynthesis protein D